MGVIRFETPHPEQLPPSAAEVAYFVGRDEIPSRSRLERRNSELRLTRHETESGNLIVPWTVPHYGQVALQTGTLIERDRPYLLNLELARGTINRIRQHAAQWSGAGMVLPDDFQTTLRDAIGLLAKSATRQEDRISSTEFADLALTESIRAEALLAQAYAVQSAQARRLQTPRTAPLLGVRLDERVPEGLSADSLADACNSFSIPLSWRSIELERGQRNWAKSDALLGWAQAHGAKICAGPLVSLRADSLPLWIVNGDTDFDGLLDAMSEHIRAVVERYRGRVHLWHSAEGVNSGDALPLAEDQRLRLAVRALEAVRASDPRGATIVSFGQPWGESLRSQSLQLAPIHFADALSRGDLGMAGIGLEIELGLGADQTLPRGPLEFCRQIDRWSVLNLPLVLLLAVPSEGTYPPKGQAAWLEEFLPVLLGKQFVQAIYWSRLRDPSHAQPGANAALSYGLIDKWEQPKPALGVFARLKRQLVA